MTLASTTQALFRIGLSLLFTMHGLQKLFGMFGGRPVDLASLSGVAGVFELIGGVLMLVGFCVRPVAMILAVEMIAAFAIAHAPRGGLPIQNGGELPLLYALAFVFFAGNGARSLSVDAMLRRRPADGKTHDHTLRRAA